jgi:hypothetical protein
LLINEQEKLMIEEQLGEMWIGEHCSLVGIMINASTMARSRGGWTVSIEN